MSGQSVIPAYGALNGAAGNEDDDTDIIVVGTREKKDITPTARLVIQSFGSGGSWPSYSNLGDWIAQKFRELFLQTTINVNDGGFDQHHRDLIAQVMQKLASSKQFKDAWDHLQQQHLKIDFQQVQSPSQLFEAQGDIQGFNPDLTISDGARLIIRIAINNGGEPISDKLFVTTVLHELIHAFGNPAWTARLDDYEQHWDDRLYRELFADRVSTDNQPIPAEIAHVAFSSEGGGTVSGDATHGILVGSVSADIFSSGPSGNIILSGGGDDQIAITLGGGIDEIEDEGGNDTLILPGGATLSNVHVAWSPDGKDIEVSVNGVQEAIIVDAATSGALESIRIGGVDHNLPGMATTANATPAGNETVFDIIGSYQGLIGTAAASDAEGNTLHYRLASLDGAYVDQNWAVTDNGQIYANFLREDQPGSEFTFLTIIVSDGVSASEFTETVHWGSSGDIGPVFGSAAPGDSMFGSNDIATTALFAESVSQDVWIIA